MFLSIRPQVRVLHVCSARVGPRFATCHPAVRIHWPSITVKDWRFAEDWWFAEDWLRTPVTSGLSDDPSQWTPCNPSDLSIAHWAGIGRPKQPPPTSQPFFLNNMLSHPATVLKIHQR